MEIRDALTWYLLVRALGLGAFPLTSHLFHNFPDRGYSLSATIGLVLLGFLAWFSGIVFGTPVTSTAGWISLSIVFCASLFFVFVARSGRSGTHQVEWKTIVTAEVLFFSTFTIVLLMRAFHPEIFWGEKPMDFSFLNYFIREQHLPPTDPWAAGNTPQYYYFGYFLFGLLSKMIGTAPGIAFNLSLGIIGGLFASSVFGSILFLTRNLIPAVLGSILITLGSNLEGARLYFIESQALTFNFFWKTTRLLTPPTFAEYPSWSFLFGDLHAHVMNLPILALFVAMLIRLGTALSTSYSGFVAGFVLGAMVLTNTWDAITACIFALIILPVAIISTGVSNWRDFCAHGVRATLGAMIGFLLWLGPLYNTSSQFKAPLFKLFTGEHSAPYQLLSHFGVFVFPVALCFITSLFMAHLMGEEKRNSRIAMALFIAAAVLIVSAETLVLSDRMNTVFKFFYPAWTLLGISAVSLTWFSISGLYSGKLAIPVRFVCYACIGVIVLIAFAGTGANLWIMAHSRRVQGPRPTLNGAKYLMWHNPGEDALAKWLNRNVRGTPVILEAHGAPYREFTRISMHTGLPTVLGWRHHVNQRGVSRGEIDQRRSDIQKIYNTTDPVRKRDLLRRYNVQYIVIGALERKQYNLPGLNAIESSPDHFEKIFSAGAVSLYQVNSSESGSHL